MVKESVDAGFLRKERPAHGDGRFDVSEKDNSDF
jgi:hypothetical protein